MNTTELAWAAGLLEGEGSFLWRPSNSAKVSCQMTDLDVLERLQAAFECGSIVRTTKQQAHHKDAWVWWASGQDAIKVMGLVRHNLGARRQGQVQGVLDKYQAWRRACEDKLNKQQEKIRAAVKDHEESGESLRKVAKRHGMSHVTLHNHIMEGKPHIVYVV